MVSYSWLSLVSRKIKDFSGNDRSHDGHMITDFCPLSTIFYHLVILKRSIEWKPFSIEKNQLHKNDLLVQQSIRSRKWLVINSGDGMDKFDTHVDRFSDIKMPLRRSKDMPKDRFWIPAPRREQLLAKIIPLKN